MENQILRKLAAILCLLAVAGLLPIVASAEEVKASYTIYVDDELVVFENPPIVDQNNILVEFRTIFERLGYQVGWDAETNTAYGYHHDRYIAFPINQAEAVVNGEKKPLPVHTRVTNGRTMIPLRFLSEESGYEVIWESSTSSVYIKDMKEPVEGLAPVSNISLNGYVELTGIVDEYVRMIRLDISHVDETGAIHQIYLEPMDGRVEALVKLPYGSGIYTMQAYTSDDHDRYGEFILQETFKITYPENEDLIVAPQDEDPHRYTVKMRLSPEAEDAVLKITKLDREAHMNITIAAHDIAGPGLLEEEVYLAFGPGVYEVKLFELYDGNQQIKTSTVTHTGQAGIALDTVTTDDSQLRVSGKVSPEMQWMWIQYANTTQSLIRNAFVPIHDGEVDQILRLNMGEGLYQVKIEFGHEGPYNSGYTTTETFEVENLDSRNRHLLPSESVQSEHEQIIDLVSEITAGMTTDQDKSLAIHDWVATHVTLDMAEYTAEEDAEETAVAVMEDSITTDIGFARLNAALHRAAGIPAKIVSGELLVGDEWVPHMWNEIYIEGRWMIQDAARDAGVWDLESGIFTPSLSHEYYDPEAEKFAEDHRKSMDKNE